MTIVCYIWMICLELNWFVYDPSWMLHLSEFVWALSSSVWVVFNNFLLIDATDRSKINSDQKRFFFIALSLYPLSFFANTPFLRSCILRKIQYAPPISYLHKNRTAIFGNSKQTHFLHSSLKRPRTLFYSEWMIKVKKGGIFPN